MNNYELYDAITKIDDRLIARASLLRLNRSADRNARPAARKKIRTGAVIGIAAAVLALAVASGAAATAVRMNGAAVPKTDSPTAAPASDPASVGTGTEQPADDFPARRVEAYSHDNSAMTGKPSASPIYSIISTPTMIRNNCEFTIKCSFGLPYSYPLLNYSDWKDEYDFTFSIKNKYRGYNDVYYSEAENGGILFWGTGCYSELIDPERLITDYIFDPGLTVVHEGNRTYYRCTNIQNVDSLPFLLSVPCAVGELSPGTIGAISVKTVFSKDGKETCGDGSLMYYYCSGDYIGFGRTEEEAYNNSFIPEPDDDTVEAVDAHQKQGELGFIDGMCY